MSTSKLEKTIARLEEENKDLHATVEELSILNDIATAISSTQSLEEIQTLIINKVVKHLVTEEGVVMLLNEQDTNRPFQTMIRKKNSMIDSLPFRLDDQMMGRMLQHKTAILVNDFNNSKVFNTSGQQTNIRSLLCVPMFVKGRLIGLIAVFNKQSEDGFTQNDQRLLAICATQAGQVIETARLYNEEKALNKLKQDMRLAREIQKNLLPKQTPNIEGYIIAGKSMSARDVGGDFYDFIPLSKEHLAVILGDISGKGIPASLLMSNLHAILRTQSLMSLSCSDCLTKSNNFLYESSEPDKFATLFYSILNFKEHTLSYCSAGHDLPIVVAQNGEKEKLENGDTILGILPDYPFKEKKINVKPDDIIVTYTDGITEAENNNEEQFGEERLVEIIKKNKNEHPDKLIDIIINNVKDFAGDVPQHDDITLTIVKRMK